MKWLLTVFLCVLVSMAFAQGGEPALKWKRFLGGSKSDYGVSIAQTTDDNFIIVGQTPSQDGDLTPRPSVKTRIWALKINADGQLLWQKTFGGSEPDIGCFITATPDGGAIFTAQADSRDLPESKGLYDIYVVKLDKNGNIEWHRCYGGKGYDYPGPIRTTLDGGYIFTGTTESYDGDITAPKGGPDVWIVKLTATGNIQWQKCLGNSQHNEAEDIRQMPNGNYVITVNTMGDVGDFIGVGPAAWRFLARLDADGNIIDTKQISNLGHHYSSVYPINNDEFIICGQVVICKIPSGYYSLSTHITHAKSENGEWKLTQLAELGNCQTGGFSEFYYSGGMSTDGQGHFYFIGGALDTTDGIAKGFVAQVSADGNPEKFWTKFIDSGPIILGGVIPAGNGALIAVGFNMDTVGYIQTNHAPSTDVVVVKLGKYNTIKGTVFSDNNKNGLKDIDEPFVNNVLVESAQPGFKSSSLTKDGAFFNEVDTGNYTTRVLVNDAYFTVVPASHPSAFSSFDQVDSTSFALQSDPGQKDYVVSLIQTNQARPGFPLNYEIVYENAGTAPIVNGQIRLITDSLIDFVSSIPSPAAIAGDTLTWNVVNQVISDPKKITLNLRVNAPPAVIPGDTLTSQVLFDSTGDLTPGNNYAVLRSVVSGSYDPNDKQEAHAGFITSSELNAGKPLLYTIRFQNTGNDTAFNVVIRDTLPANTDWTSLEMVESSHPYTLTISNGRFAKWTFANILLVDSNMNEPLSHGYISFRIKPAASIALNEVIKNRAAIYFDYNLPVITNTTETKVKPEAPSTPVITGLQPAYCNTAGVTKIKISNLPGPGSGITVTVNIDANTVAIGADSTFSFNVSTLAAGAHTISVQFSNSLGNRTNSAGFNVTEAVTPDVNLQSNMTNITSLATPVILTGTNAAGGGTGPLYTFARDRNFTNILQAESAIHTLSFDPSILAIGDNMIYIRMRSNATCVVANTATDSVLLKRSSVTGITDPDMPGQVIDISPNPFSDVINISGLSPSKTYTVSLYDMHGRKLTARRVTNRSTFSINRQFQPTGVYWLSIYDEKRKKLLGTAKLLRAR